MSLQRVGSLLLLYTASSAPAPAASSPTPAGDCTATAQYTRSSEAGQVAIVGALDVQDQLTEASVFSRRNLIVNGLVLVGTVAGGYAFIGSTAWTQGIGAYNSAFIPGLQKFWPDRRIDQEKNVLSFGYRTDQSTAIAKDDHGSYYAFFPLAVFLMPNLKALFLSNPPRSSIPGKYCWTSMVDRRSPRKARRRAPRVYATSCWILPPNFRALLRLGATLRPGEWTKTQGGASQCKCWLI
jgi:hypothetical protein